MEQFYLLRLCRTSAAYEVIPRKNIKINLDEYASKLKMHGYEIVCNAKVMLVVRNSCEISIYPSGKFVIKTNSKEVARGVAAVLYDLI